MRGKVFPFRVTVIKESMIIFWRIHLNAPPITQKNSLVSHDSETRIKRLVLPGDSIEVLSQQDY